MIRDNNKKVSIIIPIYNMENYIDRCLTSVTIQLYKELEIILVNDGSTDNSGVLCEKWAKQDKRIIYIQQSNKGVSAARNAGIRIASGDYISFIDPDDWIADDYVFYLISLLENYDGEIAVCDFNMVDKEESLNEQPDEEIDCLLPAMAEYELMSFDGMLTGHLWNKLFQKTVVKNIKFNEKIFCQEDELFFHQALSKCTRVVVSNQKKYYYFQHSESVLHREYNYQIFSALAAMEKIKENLIDEGNLSAHQEKYMTNLLGQAVAAVRMSGYKQRWYWLGILHEKMKENRGSLEYIKRKNSKLRAHILVFNKEIFYIMERGIVMYKNLIRRICFYGK